MLRRSASPELVVTKGTFERAFNDGEPCYLATTGHVCGPIGIHKDIHSKTWRLTHVVTGMSIPNPLDADGFKSLTAAKAVALKLARVKAWEELKRGHRAGIILGLTPRIRDFLASEITKAVAS